MKKYKILSFGLVLTLLLSGCGTKLDESLNGKDIIPSGTMANDIASTEYLLVCENENLSFWFNKDTTAFKIVNKTDNHEWYSTASEGQSERPEDAPFTLTYVNQAGKLETIDAMTGSISSGQYEYARTENGMDVTYSLGDFTQLLIVPLAVDKERIDFLIRHIEDDFEKGQFENMYQLVNLKTLDEENKKIFLEQYPALKEKDLYVLRESITTSESKMKELAMLLKTYGYTEEMYKEDSRLFNKKEEKESVQPQFRIKIKYELLEDGLRVTVPAKDMQMNAEFPVIAIELHKYFASPKREDCGYFLLPDGSGSLMNFYNGRGDLQDYHTKIYGMDYAAAVRENAYNYDQAYLPVWGVKNGSHALFSLIEKGDAIAEIHAFPGNDTLAAYAAPTFQIRSYQKMYLSSSNNTDNYFVNLQKKRYSDDIVIRHVLLDGDKSDLSGMAKWYAEYLFADSEPIKPAAPGLMLECVGYIEKQAVTAGIKYKKQIPTTTFHQTAEIADGLTDAGIANLSLKFNGWNGKGYAANIDVVSCLGGEKDFKNLAETLKSRSIGFYPDVDFQYTYTTGLLDGFSTRKDVATLISKAKGYKYFYNPATFEQDPTYKKPVLINTPKAISRAFDSFFSKYGKYDISGIGLGTIGKELNADYADKNGIDRQEASEMLRKSISEVAEKHTVLTKGINAYTLKYAAYCTDVPLISNERDNTNESVPFAQMVMSGYVRYSGKPINLSGGCDTLWLRMASVAADAYYVVTGSHSDKISHSENTELYCTDYAYLKDDMIDAVKEYQEKMKGLSGKRIIDYQKLAHNLYRTEFEGGSSVTVNYGTEEITHDGNVFMPKSYTVTHRKEGV